MKKKIADAKKMISEAKEKLKHDSKRLKRDFREEVVKRLPDKERKAARERLKKAQENNVLERETILNVYTDNGLEEIAVSEILKNPEVYNKLRCCDPIDPSYKDYSPCALINLDSAYKNVYDFHTDTIYRLEDNEPTAILSSSVGETTIVFCKYILPSEYFISDGCIYEYIDKSECKYKLITHSVIAVSKRTRKPDGTFDITLVYDDNGITRSVVISRSDIADRNIIRLSGYGIDVNANNYRLVSKYVSDIERANLGRTIVEAVGLQTLGHARLGKSPIFLTGTEYISTNGVHSIMPEDGSSAPIEYIYPDAGTKVLFDSISRNGDREKWIEAVKKLNDFPYAKIAVATAACTPMMKLLGIPNFIIHYGYPSSSGKSSCLKIAASAVGNSELLIETWNSTPVAIEKKSYYLCSLPLFLDETKTITGKKRNDIIRNIIYMFSSGVSKGRGTKMGGRQEVLRWNSVCFSTGEANLLYEVEDGGAKARVIDLPDMPFKERSNEIGELIDSVISDTQDNYGHAVVEVMYDILKDGSNSLDEAKTRFEELYDDIKKALPPGVGIRLANLVAFILLAIEKLNKAMGLGWTTEDVKTTLVECALKQAVTDSEGNKALSYIYSFAIANQSQYGNCNEKGVPPSYDTNNYKRDTEFNYKQIKQYGTDIGIIGKTDLIIIDSFCKNILKEANFEPNSVFKEWKQKGYLDCSGDGFTSQPTLYGGRPRVIHLNYTAMGYVGHYQRSDIADMF